MALFSDVRTAERPRFRFFFALSALLGAAQVVGVAASEALFLAEFGIAWLPHTFIAASLATVGFSYLYATVVGRARNDRLFEQMLAISAVVLFVCGTAVLLGAAAVIPLLVCLYWVNYAVFLNHYWTFSGDYFDTLTSKRLFPFFTVGASVGSIAGGAVVAVSGRVAPAELLVLIWALCLLLAAALLNRNRRNLRLWGPLELQEADDTSVAGIQGAVRMVRTTPIGRRLALSAVAMVLSLFVLQYLYSDVFARRFPEAEELAVFFGVYLLVTNLIEVGIELWVTPLLIRRFGVASTNLVHPLLTIVSFAALAFDFRLWAAVAARANRELVENAMAGPVRNLVYNALPGSVRGPTRAFLEGVVVYSGMAVAGIVLLALAGRLDPLWLCAAGAGTALLYLGANLGVRRQYLRTLVGELREGRLDIESLSDELGDWELWRLAELWQGMLAARDQRAASFAPQLAPQLAAHGALDALRAGLDHEDPTVRRACVAGLGAVHRTRRTLRTPLTGRAGRTGRGQEAEDALIVALDDEDASVRLAAVMGLAQTTGRRREAGLRRRLEDASPRVRASAAVTLDEAGHPTLEAMLAASDTGTVCAALGILPEALADRALPLLERPEPAVQANALEAAARLLDTVPLSPERLSKLAGHASPGVRCATVRALATRGEDDVPALVAMLLEDVSRDVRRTAAEALADLGDPGVSATEPYLRSELARGVEAAILTLARIRSEEAAQRLSDELAFRVRQAWRALLCLEALGPEDPGNLASRFLRVAIADSLARDWSLAFFLLENTEDPVVMRSVEKALRFATARSRGDALEVLSNLGDRETAHLMVLLAEPGPIGDKLGALDDSVERPADGEEALALARRSPNRWIRASLELADAPSRPDEGPSVWEDMMEKLLALKQIPLFASFTLEQLEAVARVARERTQMPGDVIMREGDLGGELYLVMTGEVHVYKNYRAADTIDLGTLGAGSYVGEMAIFDDKPRSATVVADEETRLLILAGDQFKELLMQTPEMSFQIFSELTTRIRDVEQRLEQVVREK